MGKFIFIVAKSKSSDFSTKLIDGALDFSFTGNNFADIFTVNAWFKTDNIDPEKVSTKFILEVFNAQMLPDNCLYVLDTENETSNKLYLMHGFDN